MEWDAFYTIQKVEFASEDELFSLGQRSTVQLTMMEKAGSPPRSPDILAGRINKMDISSISDRVASNGSKSSNGSGQRSEAGASMKTTSTLSTTLLETRIPVGLAVKAKEIVKEEDELAVEEENREDDDDEQHTASLRHILTQAIMLQEFVLELAASLQIRATLFDEVDLS